MNFAIFSLIIAVAFASLTQSTASPGFPPPKEFDSLTGLTNEDEAFIEAILGHFRRGMKSCGKPLMELVPRVCHGILNPAKRNSNFMMKRNYQVIENVDGLVYECCTNSCSINHIYKNYCGPITGYIAN